MANNITPPRRVSCGLNLHCVADISSSITAATESGYRFISTPIVHPRLERDVLQKNANEWDNYFTRPDLVLNTHDWSHYVVGRVSSWLNLESEVAHIRKNSEKVLEQELNYAAHLGLTTVVIEINSANCINLSRIIANKLESTAGFLTFCNIWVHIPMEDPLATSSFNLKTEENRKSMHQDSWDWWNTIRNIVGNERRLGLALEMSADIPSPESIKRWLGEPIRCCVVPTFIFLTNKKGFPVLSRGHQDLVRQMFKLDTQFIITGTNRHEHIKYYQQYITHLFDSQEPEDAVSKYARGYEDHLQIPLQPLMDNLESYTYEVFEKDPVKYTEYQRAIHKALVDKVPESEKEHKTCVVMVVGAGRGPLVRAALTAAHVSGRKIKVYAVEKNPNAIVTLLSQKEEIWKDQVTVVSCDMRDWEAPEKADILISELLGSFGDNELSPECLDGAQKFLCEDGISIPASYTSYISPLQSHKLYVEVAQSKEKDKYVHANFETPYVVRLHNRTELAPPQALFHFSHPKTDLDDDNTRYKSLTYKISNNCVLHGFAGYFETVLYKDISLSILPETHSPGMFSWFPVFFPIRDPIYLNSGTEVELHFWRCRNKKNVWYEYCVTKPITISIHNPNGRSYTIGL